MQASEMIKGKYYHIMQGSSPWIIIFSHMEEDSIFTFHFLQDSWFGKESASAEWGGEDLITELREASLEEIRHLDACIQAGKYVKAPQSIKYEIY